MIQISNTRKSITVDKGHGYFDLSRHPWGGKFCRFTESFTLPVLRIVKTYNDGSPRWLIALYNGVEVGIKL